MQLPDQLLNKLRILIDKPISPQVNKQLLPLLLHENLQVDRAIPLLTLKYRCDLLNHLLQNNRYPSKNTSDSMIKSILNNLLNYKIPQVLQLYIMILTKIEEDKKLLQIGYHDLLKLAIRLANLQTKQKIFQIILSNCEYFYKRKCKKVIMAIYQNYLQIFSKFMIYVPSYVSIIELGLEIDKNSKKIINKQHPERQPELQQIFLDLTSQELSMIKTQLMSILENTKQKINNYSLHRNCLNALKKLGDNLNQFKVKQSQLHFTQVQVGFVIKTIQIFSQRKGTIDQAKIAKNAWVKRYNDLKITKQQKSQKIAQFPVSPSLIMQHTEAEKPILIQEIISMTNNYRLKYQVSPDQRNEEATPSKIMSVSNNFLKKGFGAGGGRTHLVNEKQRNIFKEQKIKNKNLYEGIVGKCFMLAQKDIEYKSFVDPKKVFQQPRLINIEEQLNSLSRISKNNKRSQLQYNINNLPVFLQKPLQKPQPLSYRSLRQNEREEKMSRSMAASSLDEDDEQIQQINNLIELAYSYKFS